MNRVFIVSISLMFIMCLLGCNDIKGKDYSYLQKDNEDIQRIIKMESAKELEMTYTFEHKIRYIINNNYTFLLASLKNKKSNIICGYINEELYTPKRLRDDSYIKKTKYYDSVKWVTYNNTSDIKKYVDGLVISDAFIVYDFLLEKDLVYNVEYNKNLRYYHDITHDVSLKLNNDYQISEKLTFNEILLWAPLNHFETNGFYFNDYFVKVALNIIKEETQDVYVIFNKLIEFSDKKEIVYLLEEELNIYYDILSSKTIDDKSLDEKILNDDSTFYVYKKTKLKFDYIIDIIKEGQRE